MASNSFGSFLRCTTWGESHGKAIGVVIDGCPAGLSISEEEIQQELQARSPGQSPYTSPRKEQDKVEILSGLFEGQTTGAPISLIIWNHNAISSHYIPIQHLLRPGHANYTYLAKYGTFDHRGGGRASARETACRVAAGAIAKKFLSLHHIDIVAYIEELGGISSQKIDATDAGSIRKKRNTSLVRSPDPIASLHMQQKLEQAKQEGDSLGAVVRCITYNLPAGLGDPVYEKMEANLAKAMLSIPAAKGIEFGTGFAAAHMRGSEHNDIFSHDLQGNICTTTNHAGGMLGGITTGMPLIFQVAFKPTSTIQKTQHTLSIKGNPSLFTPPKGSRHDPCVALRAISVIEAMTALCIMDAWLMQQAIKQIPVNT